MSDDSTFTDDATTGGQQTGTQTTVIIAPDLEERFPDLIDLIMKSESMNNGERQYWIDILPVMSTEQINQLAAIDAKYAKEIQAVGTASIEETEENRQRKRQDLSMKETALRTEEEKEAEDILQQVQDV